MVDIGSTIGAAGSKLTGGITGTVAVIGKYLPYLLIGIFLGVIAWFVYEELFLYKYQVILKRIVGNGKQVIRDKAMEKRLKNGALLWKLKRTKSEVAIPPNDVWMSTGSGKIVVEGWLLNDKQIIWSRDDFTIENLGLKVQEVLKKKAKANEKLARKEELLEEDKLTEAEWALLNFQANYQPVSTNDRLVIAEAMEQAEFGKKDLTKLLEKALPWVAFILILIVLMFGFKFYAGPLTDYATAIAGTVAPIAENNKLTAQYLYELKNDIQVMKVDINTIKNQPVGNGSAR